MRQIKFRAWDKDKNQMREVTGINWYDEYIWVDETPMTGDKLPIESTPLMQFTGLLDKNNLQEVYEGDIIDIKGIKIGNIYENDKKETDIVIQGFGSKDWEATNKEALERGCRYAE